MQGYFLSGGNCIKHVRAEPTATNKEGVAFPCLLRGGGAACGFKNNFITEINEEAVGDDSLFEFNRHKQKKK